MESLYLKTLVEVVRTGSLSRAAEILHVTQPAVSKRIKFMEDQYGCALLDRSGAHLRTTPAGRLVYEKAESVLEIEADLVSGLHVLSGKTRIAFSCTPSFGIAHLPAILKEFMLACADGADLKFMFNPPQQILEGLTKGRFDLAVMELCECFDLSDHEAFPLPGDEMVFVSKPALGILAPDASIDALRAVPLFTRHEGCCSRILLEDNLKGVGHELRDFRNVIVLDDLHLMVQAVVDGEGIAFLSRDVLGEHLAAGRLVAHHVAGFRHARQRALVLNRGSALDGPSADFVTALFNHFDVRVPSSLFPGRREAEPEPGPACEIASRRTLRARVPAVRNRR
ncbi:MAG: LysR family transcriptional regulator [Acidobacteria bacterium]|nr:LysR family transcriptional regulator [Acidobacteriota bacterium]